MKTAWAIVTVVDSGDSVDGGAARQRVVRTSAAGFCCEEESVGNVMVLRRQ